MGTQNNFKRLLEQTLTEGVQPKGILSIWDDVPKGDITGQATERYTIVLDPKQGWDLERNGFHQMLAMAEGGIGISQFTSGQVGRHLGKKIKWNDLSRDSQNHITSRLKPIK